MKLQSGGLSLGIPTFIVDNKGGKRIISLSRIKRHLHKYVLALVVPRSHTNHFGSYRFNSEFCASYLKRQIFYP